MDRYSRQSILPFITETGQGKIGNTSVLIIGCGALGSIQAELLTRAGIGKLVIVDRDIIELHNLQRQFLYTEEDVSNQIPKAFAAKFRLSKINSDVSIDAHVAEINHQNVEKYVLKADYVLDATDNFYTRFLINDACIKHNKTWVYGGVLGAEGTVLAIVPEQGPCLRCFIHETSSIDDENSCERAGVLGSAVSVIASIQVTELLKKILQKGNSIGTLYSVNLWNMDFRSIRLERNTQCPCCHTRNFEILEQRYLPIFTSICSRNAVQFSVNENRVLRLNELLGDLSLKGLVRKQGYVIEVAIEEYRLLLFTDNRFLLIGTQDIDEARKFYVTYIEKYYV